jgi:RNA polymerase sigma-70 factor (ECF subfamily)
VSGQEWLAKQFEENREQLRAIAQRMLGSPAEAEDAVQEAWLRLSRTDAAGVENLGGWLTTVVSRVCLDALRARRLREDPEVQRQQQAAALQLVDPERDVHLADSVGSALLVVLDALAPAERVAFVLHDMFDMTFEEIAPIVGRSTVAARQLASRARRRVRGGRASAEDAADRGVVQAFLAASREGRFDALLALLDPDVVLRADAAAVEAAAVNRWGGTAELPSEVHGAQAVAGTLHGRSGGVRPAVIDDAPGAVWMYEGRPRAAWLFAVEAGRIVEIALVLDPAHLAVLDIVADPAPAA